MTASGSIVAVVAVDCDSGSETGNDEGNTTLLDGGAAEYECGSETGNDKGNTTLLDCGATECDSGSETGNDESNTTMLDGGAAIVARRLLKRSRDAG